MQINQFQNTKKKKQYDNYGNKLNILMSTDYTFRLNNVTRNENGKIKHKQDFVVYSTYAVAYLLSVSHQYSPEVIKAFSKQRFL